MRRKELEQYIEETYSTQPDYPFPDDFTDAVFRHAGSRKWFALLMTIPKNRLGIPGTENIDILNVKCNPALVASFVGESGIYPAYHMNKDNWLTIALDNSAEDEKLKFLLDISWKLTAPKIHRRGTESETN